MLGRKLGYGARHALLGSMLTLVAGCSAGEVSAGDEGDAINLGRCYGVDCGSRFQTAAGSEATPGEPCGVTMGALSDPVYFEPAGGPGLSMRDFKLSPDGSVWQLAMTAPQDLSGLQFQEPVLIHYSAEGQLLGVSEPLEHGGAHTLLSPTLVVDAQGNALVAVYSVYAETADSELEERLNLYPFAPDFSPLGAPIALRGIGVARMAADPSGGIVIAGNALNNAAHGVVARLDGGEADWIQTGVPTSGQGAGVGVGALAVNETGGAAVVSQRSKRWDGGPDVYTYGVATYEADGTPAWDLQLPTPYEGGSSAAVAFDSQGDLIVAGHGYDSNGRALVRGLTKTGELSWAFTMPSYWPNVAVDAQTGRAFIASNQQLAVIEADGELCRYLDVPVVNGLGESVIVSEPFVYTMTYDGIARYELPSE